MNEKRLEVQEYSDSDLISGCLKGKELHQEVLYKRYFSFAMSVCIRYTKDRNEAMEIVNDSYMKVLENLGDYDTSKSFKAWYSRILVNTSIDNYRRNLKHSSAVSIDNIAETEEQEPDIDIELSVNDILKIFSRLPENYKLTFNLFELEGYSHDEIGKLLGVTTSTSRSNLARAKKMVRDIYMKEFNSTAKRHEAV
ncbi:MAG: sigma-70 family RNA polymerase sigma factor [Bacteroidetes bacterium]|nr:sigma-70 family RNA polymerase sigma factor [Bacteroidota bacterium]